MQLVAKLALGCLVLLAARASVGEEVLFEDHFDSGLSPRWKLVGLEKGDYRIRDNALEIRVAPGKAKEGWPPKGAPMLQVFLPFSASGAGVTATVDVTVVDKFTEPGETAGLYLLDKSGPEFRGTKTLLDGKMVFLPPQYKFVGKPGEDGDPSSYVKEYTPVEAKTRKLRIVIDRGRAYFQSGTGDGLFRTGFHSAIRSEAKQRGFALAAVGGPADKEHWVRFDNFIVTR